MVRYLQYSQFYFFYLFLHFLLVELLKRYMLSYVILKDIEVYISFLV